MGLSLVAMLASVALSSPRICVVGGGASGIFSAIAAAESSTSSVVVLEAGRETLTKVAISGGGRVSLECQYLSCAVVFRCLTRCLISA